MKIKSYRFALLALPLLALAALLTSCSLLALAGLGGIPNFIASDGSGTSSVVNVTGADYTPAPLWINGPSAELNANYVDSTTGKVATKDFTMDNGQPFPLEFLAKNNTVWVGRTNADPDPSCSTNCLTKTTFFTFFQRPKTDGTPVTIAAFYSVFNNVHDHSKSAWEPSIEAFISTDAVMSDDGTTLTAPHGMCYSHPGGGLLEGAGVYPGSYASSITNAKLTFDDSSALSPRAKTIHVSGMFNCPMAPSNWTNTAGVGVPAAVSNSADMSSTSQAFDLSDFQSLLKGLSEKIFADSTTYSDALTLMGDLAQLNEYTMVAPLALENAFGNMGYMGKAVGAMGSNMNAYNSAFSATSPLPVTLPSIGSTQGDVTNPLDTIYQPFYYTNLSVIGGAVMNESPIVPKDTVTNYMTGSVGKVPTPPGNEFHNVLDNPVKDAANGLGMMHGGMQSVFYITADPKAASKIDGRYEDEVTVVTYRCDDSSARSFCAQIQNQILTANDPAASDGQNATWAGAPSGMKYMVASKKRGRSDSFLYNWTSFSFLSPSYSYSPGAGQANVTFDCLFDPDASSCKRASIKEIPSP